MAPIISSPNRHHLAPTLTTRTSDGHPLEKRHETPKEEGPTPLGWIAVAVVVPIIIIVLGLWACARYRRGWRVGEISRKRRVHGSSRDSNTSNTRRLDRDRRRVENKANTIGKINAPCRELPRGLVPTMALYLARNESGEIIETTDTMTLMSLTGGKHGPQKLRTS